MSETNNSIRLHDARDLQRRSNYIDIKDGLVFYGGDPVKSFRIKRTTISGWHSIELHGLLWMSLGEIFLTTEALTKLKECVGKEEVITVYVLKSYADVQEVKDEQKENGRTGESPVNETD